MRVECVHCGAAGQMDETAIPAGATSLRCPRCKQSFPIPAVGGIAVQHADEPLPPAEQSAAQAVQTPSLPLTDAPVHDPTPTPSPSPRYAQTPPQPVAVAEERCKSCSGQFPQDEMVRFGTAWVCAGCKPAYVQMLAQGTPAPGDMRYAGFGIRLGAKFLDGLILWVVNFLFTLMIGFALPKASPQTAIAFSLISMLLQFAAGAAYSGFFLGKFRATPGKMACGLVVVSAEGEQISFGRGFGRYFAELLSSMILAIGYLMVLFDAEKRALHDRICNTRVVHK